ncbi:MAG: hypothetical protein RIS52_304 [Pseudomonadota bacterium]
MNMKRIFRALALAALIAGPSAPSGAASRFGEPALSKDALEKAIAKAEAFPLGSPDNPVRVEMPMGQRAYLDRLRCADGHAPGYERSGNVGPGVYETIVDNYVVDCGASAPGIVNIQMDMYHPGHIENRPVAGFTIAP